MRLEILGEADATAPLSASAVRRWDDRADVVVLGCGCAGASAAIAAADIGGDVLVVERTGGAGGSAALSGGWVYLGGGTPVQHGCGFSDSVEDLDRFLTAALGPGADRGKIAAYAAGSVEHFGWLVANGVPFGRDLVDTRRRSPGPGDGLTWLGEDSAPFSEIAMPAPRGHRPGGTGLQGAELMERLSSAARARARLVTDARASRPVVASDAAVVGVALRRFGETLLVRARGGVVVATGGFGADPVLRDRYVPALSGHTLVGTDTDDGSGIRLAAGAGAAVRGMDTAQVALGVAPALLARCALVDGTGRRFINEDTYPGRIGQAALFSCGARAYCILDEATYESVPEAERMGQVPAHVSATAEELAAEIGVPAGALTATLRRYGDAAAAGVDPEFGKDPRWLRPLRPPYGALDLRHPGRLGTAVGAAPTGFGVFTLGGVATDQWGRALAADGSVVPGLFAAGRAASGMHGRGYVTGTSIGDATFFGRRAGRVAATAGHRR